MSNYVRIFDTTLRDGEQSPGATLTSSEKVEIARQLARLGVDADAVAEHRRVIAGYGLVDRLDASLANDDLLAAMGRDKKALDGRVFVLDGPNGVEQVADVPVELIVEAIDATR